MFSAAIGFITKTLKWIFLGWGISHRVDKAEAGFRPQGTAMRFYSPYLRLSKIPTFAGWNHPISTGEMGSVLSKYFSKEIRLTTRSAAE